MLESTDKVFTHKASDDWYCITPGEIIGYMEQNGAKISRTTVNRYEKQGLIPKPKRCSLGRGKGWFTLYPENVFDYVEIAWKIMNPRSTVLKNIQKSIVNNLQNNVLNNQSPLIASSVIIGTNFYWRKKKC